MDVQAGPSAKRFRKDEALVKIIYISELKRNGSTQYFSQKGANVSELIGMYIKHTEFLICVFFRKAHV